jgi:tRNA pseudouridine38-40 synthase
MRYFIKLSYKGTNYHGWQIQPNAITVQEELEKCFSLLLKDRVKLIGAGRTDTGVHALEFFAHFEYNGRISEIDQLIYKANSFLGEDIVIFDIFPVTEQAHARFSALSRTYEYRIHTIKNPFLDGFSLKINYHLDYDLMNKAAKCLFEYDDFTSFSKLHTDTKTNICKIYAAEWTDRGDQKIFTVKADRFLRNMVRAITGTLLEVGKLKISTDDFKRIIEKKDRSSAGVSVPAHALYLTKIEYPSDIGTGN